MLSDDDFYGFVSSLCGIDDIILAKRALQSRSSKTLLPVLYVFHCIKDLRDDACVSVSGCR